MAAYYMLKKINILRVHHQYCEIYPNKRQPYFKLFKNRYDRLGKVVPFAPRETT